MAPEDFVGVGGAVASGNGPAAVGADGTEITGGGTATTGSTASGGATTGGTAPGGGTGGSRSASGSGPASAVKAGSCNGFKNGPGITDKEITIATAADISGPVANVFKSAHDAMNAYAAYFNSTSSICGRKLKVQTYDSALSARGSHEASKAACASAFALVGSFSAFDSGGADVTEKCGQPDIRAMSVERARQDAATSFAVTPLDTDHMFMQPWVWAKQQFGSAIGKSGFVYLNAGASATISQAVMKGAEKFGYKWAKVIVVDLTSVPNWNQYANELKSAGITFVQANLGSYTPKLKTAMEQADYRPAFMADGSAYDPSFIGTGDQAKAMEGSYLFTQTGMMEEAGKIPEMATYQTWLSRTGGGAPAPAGAQSWAAGALFTQVAVKLGGKLSRRTLTDALKNTQNFDGNRIITPGDVGGKTTAKCATVMQIKGSKFTRVTPFPYTCGPLA